MTYLTVQGENFPVTISHPYTGDDVEAMVDFTFYKGYPETRVTPAEPPEVLIESIYVDGVNIGTDLTNNELRRIASIILEEMLQNHYNDA